MAGPLGCLVSAGIEAGEFLASDPETGLDAESTDQEENATAGGGSWLLLQGLDVWKEGGEI